MRTWRQMNNLPVATLAEGALLGKCDDFQFDLGNGAIYGYRIRGSGVFGRTGGVAAPHLRLVGRDLVYVTEERAVEWAGLGRNLVEGRAWAARYRGTRVVTRQAAGLGSVEDYFFEAQPPQVTGFLLDGGRLLRWDDRVAVGRESVIVADPALALALDSDEPETTDWWSRVRGAFNGEPR